MTATAPTLVPLESGDQLTRAEFHRRYVARSDIKKAEIIDGVVYVASPVGPLHAEPHASVIGWLYVYTIRTAGLHLADNATLLIADGEVQPDAMLYRSPEAGGRVQPNHEGFLAGVPDLIVEVAASSASYDLHSKKRLYERGGVPEYVVWQVYEQRIDWFRLTDGRYLPVAPDHRGVIESAVFPGLRLNVPKMLAGDDAGVVAELT